MRNLFVTTALLGARAATSSQDGFVAFFLQGCPAGWSALPLLEGRLALLVNNSYQSGATSGFPLSDGEDRAHAHSISGTLSLGRRDLSALGGSNTAAAKAGAQPLLPFFNESEGAPSGFPFVQLTPCRYSVLSLQPAPSLPAGAIALWDPATTTSGCPAGSAPLAAGGDGRLLAVGSAAGLNRSDGAPLFPIGADLPSHAHGYSGSINLRAVDFAGIAGCCDKDVATSGSAEFSGTSGASHDGLPYASILACNTTGGASTDLPAGAILLSTTGCPAGWRPLAAPLANRFVVGTPSHGLPSRVFGGAPLPDGGAGWSPSHNHAWSLDIALESVGVELASGCCAHDYGSAETYSAAGTTAAFEANASPWSLVGACVRT